MEFNGFALWSLVVVLVLAGFLPLMAFNYYHYRRHQRLGEIRRLVEKLRIDQQCEEIFCRKDRFVQFMVPVVFVWLLSLLGLGLSATVLGNRLGALEVPWAKVVGSDGGDPLLVLCMAFLGAYLWAVQDIFSRYSISYLRPAAYYSLSLRMVFACAIALLVHYPISVVTGEGESLSAGILPAVAFLIGSFPQRGLQWLQQRIPLFRQSSDPSVEELPLSMIEGMTAHDDLRFSELGIDNCYDLAAADFIPLLFKTPYPARQLIDWLLQAKLCVCVGTEIRELRQRGLRTIVDVGRLEPPDIEKLAAETRLTEVGLRHIRDMVQEGGEGHGDIQRLCRVAHIVGTYWLEDDDPEAPTLPSVTRLRPALAEAGPRRLTEETV